MSDKILETLQRIEARLEALEGKPKAESTQSAQNSQNAQPSGISRARNMTAKREMQDNALATLRKIRQEKEEADGEEK
jgi:hypothetical protein